jgi:hypothetical protein
MSDPDETTDSKYRRMIAGTEVFLDEDTHGLGWQCWDCDADKIGYDSWREAQADADDHTCQQEDISATKPNESDMTTTSDE